MRRQARELALQHLYRNEFTQQISISDLVTLIGSDLELDPETLTFAQKLVTGVQEFRAQIDSRIQSASAHWKIDRMAVIDRNILRIATYELVFTNNPLRENIIINEAIEIAKKYGTVDSANFVNGVLDQIAKSK